MKQGTLDIMKDKKDCHKLSRAWRRRELVKNVNNIGDIQT